MSVVTIDFDDYDVIDRIAAEQLERGDYIQEDGFFFGGTVVEYKGRFFWIAEEFDGRERLPAFVRSRADASAYFRLARHWYAEGVAAGIKQTKTELRRWLCV